MKSKKIIAFTLMLIGALLVVSAIGLLCYNYYDAQRAEKASLKALPAVKMIIERSKSEEDTAVNQEDIVPEIGEIPEMTIVNIDGYDYIGVLSIPSLGIELPVMSDWDYSRLKIAPCRYYGSVFNDDLIIAAHNYSTHFKNIINLIPSDIVIFTDMNGLDHIYSVVCTDMIKPTDVSGMLDSGFDLSLYTCTQDGQMRITVRCERASLS